jgi:hypothetical protein
VLGVAAGIGAFVSTRSRPTKATRDRNKEPSDPYTALFEAHQLPEPRTATSSTSATVNVTQPVSLNAEQPASKTGGSAEQSWVQKLGTRLVSPFTPSDEAQGSGGRTLCYPKDGEEVIKSLSESSCAVVVLAPGQEYNITRVINITTSKVLIGNPMQPPSLLCKKAPRLFECESIK